MGLLIGVLLAALSFGQAPADSPTLQTEVYYNARMALREGDPTEAVKLRLLRNAIEDQTDAVSVHDEDFGSLTWAALGRLGVCQDGEPKDTDSAGIWPLALYNWVVINRTRNLKQKRPRVFDAFQVDMQQRFFAIGDVLSARELSSVSLYRGRCTRPRLEMIAAEIPITAKLSDRVVAVQLMEHLLHKAELTLDDELVHGRSIVLARLFDVHLVQAELAAREARIAAREAARTGRQLGMSRESVAQMTAEADPTTLDPDGPAARILRMSTAWSVDEWMALSPNRRLFLFSQAKAAGEDPQALDRIALGVIDRLIAQGDGEDVERWIAHRSEDVADQEPVWSGDRGTGLLSLDRAENGFRERAVIALHRGVNQLERGDLPGSLRSMAYAIRYAPESRVGDEVNSLALRWLTYIAAQFELTDELLVTLEELVPRREYAVILEDLLWGAAFRADSASFERGARHQRGRGALERRVTLLRPLSKGDVRGFSRLLRQGLDENPAETVRFLDQWIQRLELEDSDVRTAQTPTLHAIRQLLEPLATDAESSRQQRTAARLMDQARGILEGVGGMGTNLSDADRAAGLGPGRTVHAGAVRLAPSDPLPWPFRASPVTAPSVFEPIELVPIEWTEGDAIVFGWAVRG